MLTTSSQQETSMLKTLNRYKESLRASWSRLWQRMTFRRPAPAVVEDVLLLDVEAPDEEDTPDFIGLRNSYHIRSLLNRLPTYFDDLRALRKLDDTAYKLFASLGGAMCGDAADGKGEWLRGEDIPPETLLAPPHVRCLFLNVEGKKETDTIAPLLYAMRMAGGQLVVTQHGHAALPPGLNYRMVMVFREKGKSPVGEEWFVHIDSEGAAHVLPEMVLQRHYLPQTKRARRLGGGNSFARKLIRTEPPLLALAAKEKGCSTAAHAQLLSALVLSAGRPKDCVLVRATLGHETAAWTIDRNDAKRFFRQRETSLAADAKRKRVLHYVAPFTRSNGQQVREHYRGERAFDWNGYRVEVSGLGFHHSDMFDAEMSQFDADTTNQKGMISLRKAVKKVRARYRKPVFLSRR